MDQPSVRQDHVVVTVIPPAPNASNIASVSAAAALGFQVLNAPIEGVPTADAVSTSGASANPQPSRSSGAPGSPTSSSHRRPWRNPCPCSWRIFDLVTSSTQIILLVVFLSVYRDEDPHVALLFWAIAYGAACLAMLSLLYCTYIHQRNSSEAQSFRIPYAVSALSRGTRELAGESQIPDRRHRRIGKILKLSWKVLNGFFVLWFCVGLEVVNTHWSTWQAPHLNRLCTGFLAFSYIRFILSWTAYFVVRYCVRSPVLLVPFSRNCPRGASAAVISALPTYKFHVRETTGQAGSNEDDDDDVRRGSIGGDGTRVAGASAAAAAADQGDECCICLDSYEEGVEVKELPCAHSFHVQCIDRWLHINGSCPICKGGVGSAPRTASAAQPALTMITVL